MSMATLLEAFQRIVKGRKSRRKDGHRLKGPNPLIKSLEPEIKMAKPPRQALGLNLPP